MTYSWQCWEGRSVRRRGRGRGTWGRSRSKTPWSATIWRWSKWVRGEKMKTMALGAESDALLQPPPLHPPPTLYWAPRTETEMDRFPKCSLSLPLSRGEEEENAKQFWKFPNSKYHFQQRSSLRVAIAKEQSNNTIYWTPQKLSWTKLQWNSFKW